MPKKPRPKTDLEKFLKHPTNRKAFAREQKKLDASEEQLAAERKRVFRIIDAALGELGRMSDVLTTIGATTAIGTVQWAIGLITRIKREIAQVEDQQRKNPSESEAVQ